MLSAIVTANKEAATVEAAVMALIQQEWPDEYEILVLCPDPETSEVVRRLAREHPQVWHLADRGEGKPAALNQGIAAAEGSICIFTDGDVRVEPGAMPALLAPFADPSYGAVAGRPISASPRSTMLGYWSHLLTDVAHRLRRRRTRKDSYLDCSGYLYAVRRQILGEMPAWTLADDVHISQQVWEQGWRIAYAPEARVAVRYPTTYQDWLLQKVRSTSGAAVGSTRMRSFGREAIWGLPGTLLYPRSLKEAWWTLCLLGARIHLWAKVWIELHIRRRSHREIWQRVESTK